jgi:outer membrane protein assembly factor BamE (lipoprotein component of BamABCDE complex)
MEYLGAPLIVGVVIILIVIFVLIAITGEHKNFIKNAQLLKEGMTLKEVIDIMGYPTSKEKDDDKTILIFEKSQWKGIQHGGTVTRAVKVVFKEEKVVSISNKNLDQSTFW